MLPFADMSEKKDQEYLADGMAEEIINLLANVPGLHVPGRTSSFYFKGKPTKIPDIARELGVAQVLEGSIRLSGNHLRVTAQLVRANDGYRACGPNATIVSSATSSRCKTRSQTRSCRRCRST